MSHARFIHQLPSVALGTVVNGSTIIPSACLRVALCGGGKVDLVLGEKVYNAKCENIYAAIEITAVEDDPPTQYPDLMSGVLETALMEEDGRVRIKFRRAKSEASAPATLKAAS